MAKKKGEEPSSQPRAERRPPVHEVKIGRIKAAIWANHHETQGTWFSVTVTRSYRDGQGQWHSASSFGKDDLLVLAEILREAFLWIARQPVQAGESSGAPDGEGQGTSAEIPD